MVFLTEHDIGLYAQVPQLESVYEVNAHTNEVDDLHISCDGKQVTLKLYKYKTLCVSFFMHANTTIAHILLSYASVYVNRLYFLC